MATAAGTERRTELSVLNTILRESKSLPPEVWHEWLWGTDPEEAYHMDVLLNRNHLLGVMICRFKYLNSRESSLGSSGFSQGDRMTVMDKPVAKMTWRELKDTMSNALLEWPAFLDRLKHNMRAKQNMRQVMHLVNLCAARFGHIAYSSAEEDVMDDSSDTQPSKTNFGKRMLTPSALRRMVGSILIMYRHMHLQAVCVKVPPQRYRPEVSKYHYEASTDAFNVLCMHISLPVAARLTYRHDFPGMYNHVSQVRVFFSVIVKLDTENRGWRWQVVYFHNTQYNRTTRHPMEDMKNAGAVHVLPAIQELFPEIPLKFEEDMFDPTKTGQGWFWLLLAGRVYLVTPEPKVLYSEDVTDLLKVYIDLGVSKKA